MHICVISYVHVNVDPAERKGEGGREFKAVKKTQCSCHKAGSGNKSDKLFAAFQGQPCGNSVLPKGSSLFQKEQVPILSVEELKGES